MPNVRKRFRLVLNGEKVDEIETNAADMVRSERDGEGPMTLGLRTVHAACRRLEIKGTPARFDAFLEALDSFDELDDEDGELDALDPTRPLA